MIIFKFYDGKWIFRSNPMFTPQEIKKIASLARIHLSDPEIKEMADNLSHILQYVEQLKKLDVEHIKPTSHVLPIQDVFRPDVIKPSLSQSDALKVSPAQQAGFFKVPQVIE